MKKLVLIVAMLIVLGMVTPVDALLMVADPDTIYTDAGTSHIVNSAFSGVTLSSNVQDNAVLALGSGEPDGLSGWYPSVFGHYYSSGPHGSSSGCWSFGYAVLRADFDDPTEWVQVDFIDRWAGTAILEAYDRNDHIIATTTASLHGFSPDNVRRVTLEIGHLSSSISYILAGADNETYGVIDRLSWAVPEPTTMLLLGLGLIGLAGVRRKLEGKK